MLNSLPIQPAVRQPRGIVLVNGIPFLWSEWEVNNNGFYQADSFSVTVPLTGQREDITKDWWAAQSEISVQINAGFPNDPDNYTVSDSDMRLFILGLADEVSPDLTSREVRLTGRDYTSRLIDTKTTQKWPEKTASAIVTELAIKHGLTPVVTKTTTKVGKYYEIEHASLTTERSEWNVLSWLAHLENFDVFVRGNELHFEPKADGSNPYVIEWDDQTNAYPVSNTKRISFIRSMTLARDIIVNVHSWNHKQKKGFTKSARATHNRDKVLKSSQQRLGPPQTYTYVIPNLTPDQALQRAYALLKNISQHEMKLHASIPGDSILTAQTVIEVRGTGLYDQQYYADSVIRRMSDHDGYTMEVTAKNHNVESEIL